MLLASQSGLQESRVWAEAALQLVNFHPDKSKYNGMNWTGVHELIVCRPTCSVWLSFLDSLTPGFQVCVLYHSLAHSHTHNTQHTTHTHTHTHTHTRVFTHIYTHHTLNV
jgi:hypothetical protein